MRFSLPHEELSFEIPDDWWQEAGMVGFTPTSRTYPHVGDTEWPLKEVPLREVKAPTRNSGVRWFDQKRMLKILKQFVSGDEVYPIEVHEPPNAPIRFSVRDGFHRFYASIAAGYEYVPVEVRPYFDINE